MTFGNFLRALLAWLTDDMEAYDRAIAALPPTPAPHKHVWKDKDSRELLKLSNTFPGQRRIIGKQIEQRCECGAIRLVTTYLDGTMKVEETPA